MSAESAEPAKSQMYLWYWMIRAGLYRNVCGCSFFPLGFAGDQQDCLFKGNLDSHSTRYLLLPGCQPAKDTNEVMCM